ncbi:FAD-dependent oxidoreductase [Paraliomyxa miuraensis]|uniref:FAD-dependent oxidoreductase n=1 Tax=Paraliomyxa miuraensis TaxID=376150 RepID=UPI002257E30C|nr:FAD-dependent oxidoreductase [Paraliomyxa miuraensis]MCX4240133.1 FAD-dependent oxidoreductase [Paraliomyxa miuraensis]
MQARTILEGMSVERWPGVYVLGCIDRRVTIYSQQVRALNLAAALVASGRVKPGETAVVVGAGAAGLTCAAGLSRLGAKVVVLEAQDQILSLFRGGSTRWLHPGVYDWPLDGWDRSRAGLPLLDWEHGTVDAVRARLEEGWAEVGRGIDVRLGVRDVRIGAEGEEQRTVTWVERGKQRTKTVVLAVGFGLEPSLLPTEHRYWEGDELDHPAPVDGKRLKWLVSGCGDGALTDLFRLCIEGYQHDRMLEEYTQDMRMEGICAEIRRIEGNAEIQDDPAKLHDAYEALDAPWVIEKMQAQKPRFEVKLAAPTADFLTSGASPLNRFLAGQLYKAGRFERVPFKVENVEPDGTGVVVQYADETTESFDRVQRRHGPESALAKGFPLVAKAIENDRKYRRSKPTLTDQTRERFWVAGVFGSEERRTKDAGRDGHTRGTSDERSEGSELKHYLAKIESLHRELLLAGFETKVRVPIVLEDLYEPLDAVVNRSVQRKQVFRTSEEARGHDAQIALSRAFKVARKDGRRGVVLLGDPGSGKTTHLKQVLLKVVRDGAESIDLPAGTVPVFLPLRRLRDLEAGLPAFIEQELRDPLLDVDDGFGQRLCKRGKLLFLLDGLDEVASAKDRERVARWIEAARRAGSDNYFVVSCRFSGYALDAQLDEGFLELHLRPMSPAQVESFVHRWYGIVEQATNSDPAQAQVKAEAGANALLATLRKPEMRSARVYTMTHNPLLLTTICLVHRDRGSLPEQRVVLYEEAVSVLLERWRKVTKDLGVTFPAREAMQVLMPVAGWMHAESGRIRASVDELQVPVAEGLRAIGHADVPARKFLETIRDESGLLTGWGVDEFGFMHLGFQEYLVARGLHARVFDHPNVLAKLVKRFDQSWWQEVILLLLAQDHPPVFRRLMDELVRQTEFPQWAKSELMGLCWTEAFGVSPEPFVELLRERDGDATLGGQQLAAVELLARRMPAALDELGELLREHPATEVRRWWQARAQQATKLETKVVHGVELVLVPGGRFLMGSPKDEKGRLDREGPQHGVELSSFWLARTQVTNAQYREYMKANPQAREPRSWGDRRSNQDDQPVTGVQWHEAKAYCEWAGLRLPTEAQWEYACRAGSTTRYCSGNAEEDLARVGWYKGNSDGRLHVVRGLKPNTWGLHDMHGNVWEWCEDTWVNDYKGAEHRPTDGLRVEPVGVGIRVMRGGDFDDWGDRARSAYRLRVPPDGRRRIVGFRPAQGHRE